jgi:hypothetical protein
MIHKVFEKSKLALETALRGFDVILACHDLGEENLAPSAAYPGIVWVPMGGPVTVAKQTGADGPIRAGLGQQSKGIREIAERNVSIRLHIWDVNFKATEILYGHYVAALRLAFTAFPFRVTHEAWGIGPSPNTKEPVEHLKSGSLCVVTIEFGMPLTAEPLGVSEGPHHVTVNPVIPAQAIA